jgi:hypothetical protein
MGQNFHFQVLLTGTDKTLHHFDFKTSFQRHLGTVPTSVHHFKRWLSPVLAMSVYQRWFVIDTQLDLFFSALCLSCSSPGQ